jgi:hypothetical protein
LGLVGLWWGWGLRLLCKGEYFVLELFKEVEVGGGISDLIVGWVDKVAEEGSQIGVNIGTRLFDEFFSEK